MAVMLDGLKVPWLEAAIGWKNGRWPCAPCEHRDGKATVGPNRDVAVSCCYSGHEYVSYRGFNIGFIKHLCFFRLAKCSLNIILFANFRYQHFFLSYWVAISPCSCSADLLLWRDLECLALILSSRSLSAGSELLMPLTQTTVES